MGIIEEVLQNYALEGQVNSCERYGSGHINETYLVKTDRKNYILQKINSSIFKNVPALMDNIEAVSKHLKNKGYDERHNLSIVYTKDGRHHVHMQDGSYWRVYHFVTDSISLNLCQSAQDFYHSAAGFGTFQSLLYDFDADVLTETIPRFHDHLIATGSCMRPSLLIPSTEWKRPKRRLPLRCPRKKMPDF